MTPTSTFTWLDHNDEHQQRVREALAAFDSPDIVDPLGLGVVRDAFSDMLFPGVSTIQTRARYFVLVPWVYRRLIRDRVSSQQGDRRARDLEIAVTEALLRGSASHEGIIGRYARAAIKQLPSLVYWGGLGTWGIRRFDGTRHEYIASLDAFRDTRLARDGEVTPAHERSLWPGLPEEPPDLLETATLSLTTEEAEYLRDRAILATRGTYLSLLLRDGTSAQRGDAPWTHPLAPAAPLHVQQQLRHARLFANAVRGAPTTRFAPSSSLPPQPARKGSTSIPTATRSSTGTSPTIGKPISNYRKTYLAARLQNGWTAHVSTNV